MSEPNRFIADCCYRFFPVRHIYNDKYEHEINSIIFSLDLCGYRTEALAEYMDCRKAICLVATRTGDCLIVPDDKDFPQSEHTFIAKDLFGFLTVASATVEGVNNQYFINGAGIWWKYDCYNPHILAAAIRMGFRKATLDDFRDLLKSPTWKVNYILNETKNRASGRTTRLVDEYVQKLFNNAGDWIKIHDHFGGRTGDDCIMHKIIDRMAREHNIKLDVNRQLMKARINPDDINFLL